MKKFLFIFLALFLFKGITAQSTDAKLKRSEIKELIKTLTDDEKIKLFNQLVSDNPKLVNKSLKKALKSAKKSDIDSFMKKKDMVFTPIQKTSTGEKSVIDKAQEAKEKERREAKKAEMMKKAEASEAAKAAELPKVIPPGHDEHDGHNHGAENGKVGETIPVNTNASYVITDANAPPATTIVFEETTFDFGSIVDGESVTHIYKFTNTGTEPYVISNAKGSCGCTVPKWPKEPIAPGATGEIVVTFNSRGKGKEGGQEQSKRVTLTGNTDPSNTYLTIKGIVTK